MGRRALRKIDPQLDLSKHLKTLEELPRPWDVQAVFDRTAPLELEIGSGKGLFLSAAAATRPEHNYLGIEMAAKYAHFAAARLAQRDLSNAVVVHGDARRLLHEILPAECLSAVHVYFPDPWWKARHKKRRLMNEPFVRSVERTLSSGGTLHFWTDVEDYFKSTLEVLATMTHLTGPFPVAEQPAAHDLDYRTHFERRMRLHGEAIHRAEFRKA
jgi:tRNA (guanine-N7-)-methyltransferase